MTTPKDVAKLMLSLSYSNMIHMANDLGEVMIEADEDDTVKTRIGDSKKIAELLYIWAEVTDEYGDEQ